MAKILISLLGTGRKAKGDNIQNRYETTDYVFDGKLYKEQTFISNAIIQAKKIDKLFIIGTSASMWDNIAELYGADEDYILEILEKKDSKKDLKEEDLEKLNSLIDENLSSNGSKCFIIKDGENDEELWAIFEKFLFILENIDEDDEVYFEITHLFRSVSVMSFIMAEFGKTYKNFKLAGIYYGMLKKDEPSLIIDISMFFDLLEWAKAIEEIERFASFDRLVKLSQDKIAKNGFNTLNNLNEAFEIANMTAMHNSIKNLANHLDYFSKNENKIIALLSPRIEKFIKRFAKKNLHSAFQFELAKYFGEKHNYALGYIALAEAILTYICEKKELNKHNKDDRDKAKDIIREGFNYPYSHPKRKFANLYINQINRIRNNIAHQLETTKNPKDDIRNFEKYLKDSQKYLKELF